MTDRKQFLDSLVGVYNFTHAGGTFDVHLRSNERFFAPQYQAKSTYSLNAAGDLLSIDWGKFGKYDLKVVDKAEKEFSGSARDKPESWRKMKWKRSFTIAEQRLFDSVWNFQHPNGAFEVEFRADAYNHFVCNDFPAHSHWR